MNHQDLDDVIIYGKQKQIAKKEIRKKKIQKHKDCINWKTKSFQQLKLKQLHLNKEKQ